MAGGSSGDSGGSQAISLRSFTAKTRSSLDQVGPRRSADTFAGHFVLQAAEWLQKGRRRAEVQGFALVHEKIPQSVAHGLGLGVRSRVQVMVRNYNFGAAAMRAHPGLADLQQNGLARAEVLRVFSLEKANEVMSEIANVAGRPTEMMKRFSTFADQSP